MIDGKSAGVPSEVSIASIKPETLSSETAVDSLVQSAEGADLGVQVVRNTAAIVGSRGIAILFSTAATVLLARFLGSEKLGQFGAIYAYLALFGWMAAFGFEPVLVREISRQRGNASNLLHTAMVLSLFLSVGTIVVALLLAPRAGYSGHLRILLALAALEYVLTPLRLPAVIFQVDLRPWYGAMINVVRQGFWFAIIGVLWILKAPLVYVIAGRTAAALLEALLMWGLSRQFLQKTGQFLRDRSRMILAHSFPIAFTSLLAMIYLRIDQVMLHKMVSDSVLGQYVAAVKVSELFELLPSAFMFTLAPILSVSVADPEKFGSYTDRAFRYFMIAASGLCVFMTAGAKLIVHILFGEGFSPAAPLLSILIWSEIAVFFSAVVVNVLIAKNEQRLLPIPTLIGAAINIGLNLLLIPRYGAVGSAWATLTSYTLAWMVCLLFFKQTRSLTWRGLRFAIPITSLGLIAVVFAILIPVPGIAKVIASCALFGLSVWIAKFIRSSELHQFFRTARGLIEGI